MRVKCLAQEHNTMSPARTRTRTTRSGVERTNHEATAPPTIFVITVIKMLRTDMERTVFNVKETAYFGLFREQDSHIKKEQAWSITFLAVRLVYFPK